MNTYNNYNKKTVSTLRKICKELGIKISKKQNKIGKKQIIKILIKYQIKN